MNLCSRARAPQQEKPLQREAHAPQLEDGPYSGQLEKTPAATKTQDSQKKIKKKKKNLAQCLFQRGLHKREFEGSMVWCKP